jgi:hypothetical protein
VHQDLDIIGDIALVGDDDGGGERFPVKGDAVDGAELIGPESADLLVDALGGQTKVELDAIGGGLGRGLAKELPAGGACETVLGKLAELGVVGGGTKDLGMRGRGRQRLLG